MQTFITLLITAALAAALQPKKPRARDLGVPFEGTPGTNNAITAVAGVEVGFTTLIKGEGALIEGTGPVRTGVTAILPRGKSSNDPAMAGWFSLNGNGEMTGTTWIKESGFLEGPVFITNTHSVGVVRDASIAWGLKHGATLQPWSLPVVAETWDGTLNDINGFHVKPEHVFAALLPHQLERIARRASLGLARTGATSGNSSGDIFLAFSTANAKSASVPDVATVQMLSNERISALFSATVQATEEAIVNALVAAETMTGANGRVVERLPHETLKALLKKYGR